MQHSKSVELEAMQEAFTHRMQFIWYGLDMQGHGMSSDLVDHEHAIPAGLVTSLDSAICDALTFVQHVVDLSDLPFVISGHSFGAGVCIQIIPHLQKLYRERFRGAALSAPPVIAMLDFAPPMRRLKFSLCLKLCQLFSPKSSPRWTEENSPLALSKTVSDAVILNRLRRDRHRIQALALPYRTMATVLALTRSNAKPSCMRAISCPILICHGTKDTLNHVDGSKLLFESVSTPLGGKRLALFKGSLHNLFADLERDARVANWVRFVSIIAA